MSVISAIALARTLGDCCQLRVRGRLHGFTRAAGGLGWQSLSLVLDRE